MKIDFISDLHIEINGRPRINVPSDGDILLLLGDITCFRYFQPGRTDKESRKNVHNFQELLRNEFGHYKKILYIPGNHEYYGYAMDKRTWVESLDDRLILSDRLTHRIDNTLIIMATLWTSFGNRNPMNMLVAKGGMNDFRMIDFETRTNDYDQGARKIYLDPEHVADINEKHFDYIQRMYELRQPGDTVIVATHHAPSMQSHNKKRFGDADTLAYAYCNEYDEYVMDSGIDYWLHGHTHDNVDYMIGYTRVLSAMYGYDQYDPIPRPLDIGRIEV